MNQKLGIINQELEVMNIKAGIRKYESKFSECGSMNQTSCISSARDFDTFLTSKKSILKLVQKHLDNAF